VLTLSASVLIWASACCRTDEWTSHSFEDASIQFELPENWTVHVARPGLDPVELDSAPSQPQAPHGAIVTALPLLEDAAMVIVAPQNNVSTEVFARQADLFLPLDHIVTAGPPSRWGNGSFQGWASAGHGEIAGGRTPVDWRWVTLEVEGQAIIVCLYAESSQATRYNEVFNRILKSIARL
jgi:hypothetical protein